MHPPARARWTWALAFALAAIVARLPFLLSGAAFFDADDAIEGLMARHVLAREFPLFFWGQQYKGVPEVYLDAAAFSVFGSGVMQVQSVTLALFAAFVALQFVMLDRLATRPVAMLASIFVIACPPALVLWSLRGTAEIVMTLLVGTALILAAERLRVTGRLRWLAATTLLVGLGLWVQQFIVYYVVAIAAAATVADRDWRARWTWRRVLDAAAARGLGSWKRVGLVACLAAALMYLALAAYAFAGPGVQIERGPLRVSATHPQKLMAISALLTGAWVLLSWLAPAPGRDRRVRALALGAVAFAAGAAPILLGRSGGVPLGRMTASEFRSAIPVLTAGVVPVLSGFRLPDTAALVPFNPLCALPLAVGFVASFWAIGRERSTPFFHLLAASIVLVFLASGTFVDAQSYRYLMPIVAAAAVVLAMGVTAMWRRSRPLGAVLCAALIAWSTLTQVFWYRSLEPDRTSPMLIACLDARGVTRAYADYWRSYKLTFLAGERIIVAPVSGVDRYPPYTATVARESHPPTLDDAYIADCAPPMK